MTQLSLWNAKSTQTLEAISFMQVCLFATQGVSAGGLRVSAAQMLDEIAQGADFPKHMRSHVALFTESCHRLGVLRGAPAFKKLTALSLREARRNTLILEDRKQFLAICDDLEISVTEICGPLIGEAFYPTQVSRHTHALKFAIFDTQSRDLLLKSLSKNDWQLQGSTIAQADYCTTIISTAGVEIKLFHKVLPHIEKKPNLGRLDTIEFQIVMVLCQTHFEPQKATQRWFCDLAFIFAKASFDVSRVVAMINDFGLAGACANSLREALAYLPDTEDCELRKIMVDLLEQLKVECGNVPQNSVAANEALRAYHPTSKSRTQRALSVLKQAVLGAILPNNRR